MCAFPCRCCTLFAVIGPTRNTDTADIWSEEEDLQQDEMVRQSLLMPNGSPFEIDLDRQVCLVLVLQLVRDPVSCHGKNSHLFHVQLTTDGRGSWKDRYRSTGGLHHGLGRYELRGISSYTDGSYKDVRCALSYTKCSNSYILLTTHTLISAVEQSWQREKDDGNPWLWTSTLVSCLFLLFVYIAPLNRLNRICSQVQLISMNYSYRDGSRGEIVWYLLYVLCSREINLL
jgi:hypothetical protein